MKELGQWQHGEAFGPGVTIGMQNGMQNGRGKCWEGLATPFGTRAFLYSTASAALQRFFPELPGTGERNWSQGSQGRHGSRNRCCSFLNLKCDTHATWNSRTFRYFKYVEERIEMGDRQREWKFWAVQLMYNALHGDRDFVSLDIGRPTPRHVLSLHHISGQGQIALRCCRHVCHHGKSSRKTSPLTRERGRSVGAICLWRSASTCGAKQSSWQCFSGSCEVWHLYIVCDEKGSLGHGSFWESGGLKFWIGAAASCKLLPASWGFEVSGFGLLQSIILCRVTSKLQKISTFQKMLHFSWMFSPRKLQNWSVTLALC